MGLWPSLFSSSMIIDDPAAQHDAAYMQQLAQNAQMAQHNQLYAQVQALANEAPPMPNHNNHARELFIARMRGVRGKFTLGVKDFIHCQVHGDIVFVFFLLDGKEGIVKEAVDVFPSDQLIAQFRMIAA